MKVKLTPIVAQKAPKNQYFIEVTFMHGDADHYNTEEWPCDDEKEFIDTMGKIEEGLKKFRYSRDEGEKFWYEVLGDGFVPSDVTGNGDINAAVEGAEGFYYDENGVKFQAEVVK